MWLPGVSPRNCPITVSYQLDSPPTAPSIHSTETAVLSVHNDVVRSIDNGQVSLLVLLDLSAAFDTVDHQILLSVLSDRFAVANNALALFTSYLTDRTQQFM